MNKRKRTQIHEDITKIKENYLGLEEISNAIAEYYKDNKDKIGDKQIINRIKELEEVDIYASILINVFTVVVPLFISQGLFGESKMQNLLIVIFTLLLIFTSKLLFVKLPYKIIDYLYDERYFIERQLKIIELEIIRKNFPYLYNDEN